MPLGHNLGASAEPTGCSRAEPEVVSALRASPPRAEFTPGPWRVGIDGNNRVYGPDCAAEHTGLIAVVYKGAANKRLIAAAPDLCEAVDALLEQFVDPQQGVDQFDSAIVRKAVEHAQAALAKARGF